MVETPAPAPAPAAKPITVGDLQQVADSYHVPMSEATIKKIADESGGITPEKARAFVQYIQTAAEGLYPTLAPQIKAGIPTAYLLDPYRQIAKQKLGDQYEPNFQSNPADTAALTGGFDPQTGRPAPMTLTQWKQHIMSEPSFGWDKTPEAHQMMARVADQLNQGLSGQAAPQ